MIFQDIIDNREDGHSVDEQAKLVMLKLLRILDAICNEYNLQYWLSSGTLLGCIRHKGFIPWDDDIDVEMPRYDYEKFIAIAQNILPEDVFLQTRDTDKNYPLFFAKLRDKYSTYEEENIININCHKGIFIDIFPVDYTNHPKLQRVFKVLTHGTCYSKLKPYEVFIQNIFGRYIKSFISRTSFPLYTILNRLLTTEYIKAKYVSYGMEFHEIKYFPKDLFFPLKKGVFEGYMFNIPNKSNAILELLYGEYMKLPPIEDRIPHNIGVFPFKPCNHNQTLIWKKKK